MLGASGGGVMDWAAADAARNEPRTAMEAYLMGGRLGGAPRNGKRSPGGATLAEVAGGPHNSQP